MGACLPWSCERASEAGHQGWRKECTQCARCPFSEESKRCRFSSSAIPPRKQDTVLYVILWKSICRERSRVHERNRCPLSPFTSLHSRCSVSLLLLASQRKLCDGISAIFVTLNLGRWPTYVRQPRPCPVKPSASGSNIRPPPTQPQDASWPEGLVGPTDQGQRPRAKTPAVVTAYRNIECGRASHTARSAHQDCINIVQRISSNCFVQANKRLFLRCMQHRICRA